MCIIRPVSINEEVEIIAYKAVVDIKGKYTTYFHNVVPTEFEVGQHYEASSMKWYDSHYQASFHAFKYYNEAVAISEMFKRQSNVKTAILKVRLYGKLWEESYDSPEDNDVPIQVSGTRMEVLEVV